MPSAVERREIFTAKAWESYVIARLVVWIAVVSVPVFSGNKRKDVSRSSPLVTVFFFVSYRLAFQL